MTLLHVLGSGSRGNAFAVTGPEGALVIDAGFGPKAFLRRAAPAGLALEQVRGIVVTHEHGDHAEGALALARRLEVPVVCSAGTWHGLGAPAGVAHQAVGPARPVPFGGFLIEAIHTTHDANEPIAVRLRTADGHCLAFAIDIGRTTTSIRYLLRGAHAIVLESNYDELMLRTGRYPPSVQHRIAGSGGHLSNRAAADLVVSSWHSGLRVVVLAHLSQQCNSGERARATVEPALRARGFRGEVYVAAQDEPLPPIRVRAGADPGQGELPLQWGAASPARSG